MLPEQTVEAIAQAVQQAEERLLALMSQGRTANDDDVTSRLLDRLEGNTEDSSSGAQIKLTVVNGVGPGALESRLGADFVGVVRIDRDDLLVTKGFLAQAKLSGSDGAVLRADGQGHWLYRGSLRLERSGTISIGRPSSRLQDQCRNMLQVTPDSFVFVYHESQVGVVSANAVLAAGGRSRANPRLSLGTKRLDDFFVHLLDCFIGDPRIAASDEVGIRSLVAQFQARAGLLLAVT